MSEAKSEGVQGKLGLPDTANKEGLRKKPMHAWEATVPNIDPLEGEDAYIRVKGYLDGTIKDSKGRVRELDEVSRLTFERAVSPGERASDTIIDAVNRQYGGGKPRFRK